MQDLLKRICLLICLITGFLICSNAQNFRWSRKVSIYGPDPLNGTDRLKLGDTPDSTEPNKHTVGYILNFFSGEAKKIKYLDTLDIFHNYISRRDLCSIDSLEFLVPKILDSLVIESNSELLDFKEFRKNTIQDSIHRLLMSEKLKKIHDSSILSKIKRGIDLIPATKEKLVLLLQYAYVKIPKDKDSDESLSDIYFEASNIVSAISNKLDAVKSYQFLGDFADLYMDEEEILNFYYAARFNLSLCNASKNIIDSIDGELCLKIGAFFYNIYDYNYSMSSLEKASDYFGIAWDELYENDRGLEAWASYFSNNSFLLSHFLYSDSSYNTRALQYQTFNSIYYWYFYFSRDSYSPMVNYFGLSSIGKILDREGYHAQSLNFYLRALQYAISTRKKNIIGNCLANIIYMYQFLKMQEKEDIYRKIQDSFDAKSNCKSCIYSNIIYSAQNLYAKKQYKAVVREAESILTDSIVKKSLPRNLYYIYYKQAMEKKYLALYALKKKSANLYENYYRDYKDWAINIESSVFANEADLNTQYLDLRKYIRDSLIRAEEDSLHKKADNLISIIVRAGKDINNLNDKGRQLENENVQLGLKNKNLDISRNILTRKNANLNQANQKLTNTLSFKEGKLAELNQTNANLELINTRLKIDTAKLSVQIVNKNREITSLEKAKQFLYWSIFSLGLVTIGLIITSVRLSRKNKKKKAEITKGENKILELDKIIDEKERLIEEKDLERKLTEQQLLNDTALGHDFINLIDHVPFRLKKALKNCEGIAEQAELLDCIKYTEGVAEYFKSNFDLKEQLLNTIEKDIELSRKYCELHSYAKGYDYRASILDGNLSMELLNYSIPKHNIVNLVANSFKHGLENSDKNLITVNIRGIKQQDGFDIIFSDDSGGFNNLNLDKQRNTRGLPLVFRQIENYNSVSTYPFYIQCNENSFSRIINNDKVVGTEVIYKLRRK